MEAILLRQQQLEETNRQLCEKGGDLRRSLRDLDISQNKYQELRDLPEDKISIQEYIAVSMEGTAYSLHHHNGPERRDMMERWLTLTWRPFLCVFRCVSTRWWLLCGLSWLSSVWRETVWLMTWMHTEPNWGLWWRYGTHTQACTTPLYYILSSSCVSSLVLKWHTFCIIVFFIFAFLSPIVVYFHLISVKIIYYVHCKV